MRTIYVGGGRMPLPSSGKCEEYTLQRGSISVVKANALDLAIHKPKTCLLHVVNCQGVMGSGFAKEVKDRMPQVFAEYSTCYKANRVNLGTYTQADNVFNLAAQEYYGGKQRNLNYGALADCLSNVEKSLDFHRKYDIVIVPYKMGSDRSGGAWEVVSEMLEYFFKYSYIIAAKI